MPQALIPKGSKQSSIVMFGNMRVGALVFPSELQAINVEVQGSVDGKNFYVLNSLGEFWKIFIQCPHIMIVNPEDFNPLCALRFSLDRSLPKEAVIDIVVVS